VNFIVDAHLPKLICNFLQEAGFEAIHTSQLPNGNRTDDLDILALASEKKSVVISKGADFYHSFLLQKKPSKLVAVKIGNMKLAAVRSLFQNQTNNILQLLETYDLIEVHPDRLVAIL